MSSGHWGRRPDDWAELAEPSNEPLFAAVLARLGIRRGTRLLDVGCGSGYAARMAAGLGAVVTGIDNSPELLAIARRRMPGTDFIEAGMDRLPLADQSFDVVVGFNAFQFAEDPEPAVREASRVSASGGLVAATTFAEPERNQSTALHQALEPLRNPAAEQHLPYGLSGPGGLERLLGAAGLEHVHSGEVPLVWAHDSREHAIRAILASAGGAMAIEGGGEAAATVALSQALPPFTEGSGRVEMHNVFRYVIGRRPRGSQRAGAACSGAIRRSEWA